MPSATTPRARSFASTIANLEDDPDRIYVELQTAPMFGGRKIVRATAGRRVTAAQLKPLVEGGALQGYLIVEAGNLRPDDALRALFEKSPAAAAVACFPDEARDLEAVIREVFAPAKVQITPEAKRLLLLRLGADRALSRAEIDKLALYAHGKAVIEESDVEAAVGDAAELALDRIVMAAASGRLPPALRRMRPQRCLRREPARRHRRAAAALPAPASHPRRARRRPLDGRRPAPAAPAAAFQAARRHRAAVPQLEHAQAQCRARPHRRGRQGRAPELGAGGQLAERLSLTEQRCSARHAGAGKLTLGAHLADPAAARFGAAASYSARPNMGTCMQEHDVVGIGNAIVDIIARCDDAFLARHGSRKGSMQLVDAPPCRGSTPTWGRPIEISGGSAANTMVGVASFGGRAGFIGKTADDQFGKVFGHDIRAAGVTFTTPPAAKGSEPTGRCLILVTPDGQRTMNTFLGVSPQLGGGEVDAELIRSARIVYLEGYLFDRPEAKAAFRQAAEIAAKAGRQVALTLSDPFCVDRHRAEFLKLIRASVDILFANEAEIASLYQTSSSMRRPGSAQADTKLAALTRSEKGSVILSQGKSIAIPAAPVSEVVDTTGAGDLYAAGFLFGIATGRSLETAGRLGSLAAAEIICHIGARPETHLAGLGAQGGVPARPDGCPPRVSLDAQQLGRGAAEDRRPVVVAQARRLQDQVDGGLRPRIGIVGADHELARADLRHQVAHAFGPEHHGVVVELLQVLASAPS